MFPSINGILMSTSKNLRASHFEIENSGFKIFCMLRQKDYAIGVNRNIKCGDSITVPRIY